MDSLHSVYVSSEKEEEQTKLEIDGIMQMIDKEKARGAKLELKVQLHVSLNTEDEVRKQNVLCLATMLMLTI